jgi:hypothetical protein
VQPDGSILQEGLGSNGMGVRWVFSEVRQDSFRWHSEVSQDQGKTWNRALELQAHRL